MARANLLVASDERADGQVFNVGTGQAAEIGRLAEILAEKLGKPIAPQIPGEFRPGEMRALISDGSRIGKLGFEPQVRLEEGVERYLDWVREQGTDRPSTSARPSGNFCGGASSSRQAPREYRSPTRGRRWRSSSRL